MSLEINYLLSRATGLSLNQLADAKNSRVSRGAYNRLVELHNKGEPVWKSRAIEIINQKHPFNMDLISKYTCLQERNIAPILSCSIPCCKCKTIWAELKNELEKMNKGDQFSKAVPYESKCKMSVHAIYILQETILDAEDLHQEEDSYLSM